MNASTPTTRPRLTRTAAGLERYVPTAENPWDAYRAAHLLRRTLIGPRPDEVRDAVASTPGDVVDRLLEDRPLPDPPGDWATQPFFVRPTAEERRQERAWMDEARWWWASLIAEPTFSLRERMVLFWHDHFATRGIDVRRPQLMFVQNDLFRRQALGNFKTLVLQVTHDPAMLYFLDGHLNRKGSPNENYARELLELFTMGEGHYTEADIGEAARALTGWRVVGLRSQLDRSRHDSGEKTFLGRTGSFGDRDIVDIIFDQPQAATFICRKLYRAFVYNDPDELIVAQMAVQLRQNDYEIGPVLRTLLTSEHFFDETTIGSRLKSPVEHVVGTARSLGLDVAQTGHLNGEFLSDHSAESGQTLLDPPNVAGWPGYRNWISTTTLPVRHLTTDKIIDGRSHFVGRNYYTMKPPDLIATIKTFPSVYDPVALVEEIASALLPFPVTDERRELYLSVLLEGAEVYDWNPDARGADRRVANLLKLIFELPEYQLT